MRGNVRVKRMAAGAIAGSITARLSEPTFNCGDCERSQRYGLPPDEKCIVRLAQIERDPTGYEWRMKARASILTLGRWQ